MNSTLELVPQSATHRTEWRLEKRNRSIEQFGEEFRGEVHAVLAGHRGSGLFLPSREINLLAERLKPSISTLWPTRHLEDAVLHELFLDKVDPFEILEREGNILVTAGITVLLNLLIGAGGTVFSNANAYLGVGDSSAAAAVGQTDLQASSNKLRVAMNSTYPIVSSPTINFQSTFGSAQANYVWSEVATFNAATAGTMLNRVVQALGTKSSGSTWTLTETITWS